MVVFSRISLDRKTTDLVAANAGDFDQIQLSCQFSVSPVFQFFSELPRRRRSYDSLPDESATSNRANVTRQPETGAPVFPESSQAQPFRVAYPELEGAGRDNRG
jgi:hypothetical protein